MNRRTLILIGVAGILAVLVGLDQWRQASEVAVVQPVRRIAEVEIVQESGPFLPEFSSFSAIGTRPLFRADRRPEPVTVIAPVTPVQTVAATDTPPEFIIVGVVTGPDGRGAATVRDGAETRRVYPGDLVQNWRIDRINPDGVIVTRDGRRWSLPIGEREDD